MNTTQIIEFLKQEPLMAGLSQTALIALAVKVKAVNFQPNQINLREGQAGDTMYLIVSGEVEIIKGFEAADAQVLATRGPGA